MQTFLRRPSVFLILSVSATLKLCLCRISLCTDDTKRSQKVTSVPAKLGAPVSVFFCVQSDYRDHAFFKLHHPNHGNDWNATDHSLKNDTIYVRTVRDGLKATINITIVQVEEQDFSGVFSVTMYAVHEREGSLNDTVLYMFELKKEGRISLCRDITASQQNVTLVPAKLGATVSLSFCVHSDNGVYKYINITHHNHRFLWYGHQSKVNKKINVEIVLYERKATINITLRQVEDHDFNDVFSVTVYAKTATGINYEDYLIRRFQLIQKDDVTMSTHELLEITFSPSSVTTKDESTVMVFPPFLTILATAVPLKMASVTPVVTPRTASVNPVFTQDTASVNPVVTPRTASVTPVVTPRTASVNPVVTPRTASVNPVVTPRTASVNPVVTQDTATTTSTVPPSTSSVTSTTTSKPWCPVQENSGCPNTWHPVNRKMCLTVIAHSLLDINKNYCTEYGAHMPTEREIKAMRSCLMYLLHDSPSVMIRINSRKSAHIFGGTKDAARSDRVVCILDKTKLKQEHSTQETIHMKVTTGALTGAAVGGFVGGIAVISLVTVIFIMARKSTCRKNTVPDPYDGYVVPLTPYAERKAGAEANHTDLTDVLHGCHTNRFNDPKMGMCGPFGYSYNRPKEEHVYLKQGTRHDETTLQDGYISPFTSYVVNTDGETTPQDGYIIPFSPYEGSTETETTPQDGNLIPGSADEGNAQRETTPQDVYNVAYSDDEVNRDNEANTPGVFSMPIAHYESNTYATHHTPQDQARDIHDLDYEEIRDDNDNIYEEIVDGQSDNTSVSRRYVETELPDIHAETMQSPPKQTLFPLSL